MCIIWSISVLYNNIIFTFSLLRMMECGYRYKYIQESVWKLLIILRCSHVSYMLTIDVLWRRCGGREFCVPDLSKTM